MVKNLKIFSISLAITLCITACNNPALNNNIVNYNARSEGTYSTIDIGAKINGVKTGVNITVKISNPGFSLKALMPNAPGSVEEIKSYMVGLVTDPNSPFSSTVAGPVPVNRDGSPSPHTITFINAPIGGPYYAIVAAYKELNGTGTNITAKNNGGVPYSGNPGIQAALSSNSVTINSDMTVSPANTVLNVDLNLQGAQPGTDDFMIGSTSGVPQQHEPAISANSTGKGLVVWSDNRNFSSTGYDIFARKLNGYNSIGTDFQINITTAGDQIRPSVSLDSTGTGLAVWNGPNGGSNDIIFARRIVNYVPVGPEFTLASNLSSTHRYPDVKIDGGGDGMVVWADDRT